jgi:hypothetical protein
MTVRNYIKNGAGIGRNVLSAAVRAGVPRTPCQSHSSNQHEAVLVL